MRGRSLVPRLEPMRRGNDVRIATFNANSLRARMEAVTAWLARHQPDILCIQETKVQDAEFPLAAIQAAGYQAAFRGEKSYNGVAILSRDEPDEVRFGFDDGGPADETRLVWARFGALNIVNTYVPQGRELDHPMFAYKLEWFGRLRAYFERHFTPRRQVLWLGDMNVAPEPIDIHNPEKQAMDVCFHESIRRAYWETVGWGFADVYRRFHPEAGRYTFFDYRVVNSLQRNMGWRVDHLLATDPLLKTATDAWIDLEPRGGARPSDHTPLVGEFDAGQRVSQTR